MRSGFTNGRKQKVEDDASLYSKKMPKAFGKYRIMSKSAKRFYEWKKQEVEKEKMPKAFGKYRIMSKSAKRFYEWKKGAYYVSESIDKFKLC